MRGHHLAIPRRRGSGRRTGRVRGQVGWRETKWRRLWTKWHDLGMAGQRGVTDHDPGRIRRARERKRLSRASLARAINHRLRRPVATDRTIAKIENGRRVEPTRYRPVLIELGLAPEPSRVAPGPKQAPGEWVRELREAHGIPPTTFCLHARYFDTEKRMSRSTLNAIEEGRRVPSWQMVDAIATGFARSHVDIDTSHLENAWILYGGGPIVAAWGPEIRELRERVFEEVLEEEPWRRVGLKKASRSWPLVSATSPRR